jgi:hypothetical protein
MTVDPVGPCGKHQITAPKTGSDHRGNKNMMADILATGCPELALEEVPQKINPWPEDAELKCHFCGSQLDPEDKKSFCYHSGIFACLSHPGIRDWHREECRKERQQEKGEE